MLLWITCVSSCLVAFHLSFLMCPLWFTDVLFKDTVEQTKDTHAMRWHLYSQIFVI